MPVFDEVERTPVTVHREIENNGQIISLDLGKQMPSSRIAAILKLTNKTGKNLRLALVPSCNCTHLSLDTLEISPDGTRDVTFDMLVPKLGVQNAGIRLRDDQNDFSCVIYIKTEASQPVALTKGRYLVKSNEATPLEVRIVTDGEGTQIAELEIASVSHWGLQRVSTDPEGWTLFIKKMRPLPKGVHDEHLSLNCLVEKDGKRTSIPLDLHIEFSDVFRLGPSQVIPKLVDGRVLFTVFAIGANVQNPAESKLYLKGKDSATGTEVRLDSTQIRKAAIVLTGSMERQEFDRVQQNLQPENLILELHLGSMSSTTRLQTGLLGELP